jgi:hypothetical protein
VRSIGEIESDGGVRELERWLELNAPREWVLFNIFHQRLRLTLLSGAEMRFLRRFRPEILNRLRGGVGGVQPGPDGRIHVKCLHLQAASWLALRRHPGAAWLAGHGAGLDCRGESISACAVSSRAALPRDSEPGHRFSSR